MKNCIYNEDSVIFLKSVDKFSLQVLQPSDSVDHTDNCTTLNGQYQECNTL